MVTSAALLIVLVLISVIDIRTRTIPDVLSLPLVAAGIVRAMLDVQHGAPSSLLTDSVIGATAGYLLFAAIGAAFFRLRGEEGLGLGDAKLLAAAGAWLGWQMLPLAILIASVGGLVQVAIAAYASATRPSDQSLAFGPWLAFSFFSLWILSIQ